MNITEVRIKSMNVKNEKLKAFASITIEDDFVVRDLKVIVGGRGLFVAMPSRKLSDYCPKCRGKNPLKSKFCNECGSDLRNTNFGRGRAVEDEGDRANLHADIAHPVNSECRDLIQNTVVKAYELAVAYPDNRGIFTADDIATMEVPEDGSYDEEFDYEEEEESYDSSVEESAEEELVSDMSESEYAPVDKPMAEPVAVETPAATSFEAAAKQTTLEERNAEAPKKKRRFGLGIFS